MRKTLIAVLLAVFACERAPEAEPPKQPAPEPAQSSGLPDRDPALARRLVRDDGALLLDVRTSEEFESGHVEGAVLIPHTELADRIDEVLEAQGGDKSKPIVVYCGSGRRAGIAKQTLIDAGFDSVSNLGGVGDWCEDC